jgi:hypothetical protein
MAGAEHEPHLKHPGRLQLLPHDSALVLSELGADPSLLTGVWQSLAHDLDFPDLSHHALVFNYLHNAGYDDVAIARSEGFADGIAFVVQAIRHAQHREESHIIPATNIT